jgi:hypothetical protein
MALGSSRGLAQSAGKTPVGVSRSHSVTRRLAAEVETSRDRGDPARILRGPGQGQYEANLPTQEAQARTYARLSRSYAHARRSTDAQAPPR